MARGRAAGRKYHGPSDIGRPAPQFAVDEICNAAKKQADGHDSTNEIKQAEYGDVAGAGKQDHGEKHAQESTVEGHAAIPYLQSPNWVGDHCTQIVKQDVSNATACNDAQCCPHEKIIEIEQRKRGLVVWPKMIAPDNHAAILPTQQNAYDIGQTIPMHRHGPDRKQHRINFGIADQ